LSRSAIARSDAEWARLRALVHELAHVRAAVLPHLGAHAARAHNGDGDAGGRRHLQHRRDRRGGERHLRRSRGRGSGVLLKARGLVRAGGSGDEPPESPELPVVLVVDLFDGTRPGGLAETCCVSVAAAQCTTG
jgi:hypothetical protein